MAYFSNGSESESYQSNYCEHCLNWRKSDGTDGTTAGSWGCPIWDVHLIYNGDQITDGKQNAMGDLLAMLIPNNGAYAGRCRMFIPKKEGGEWGDG